MNLFEWLFLAHLVGDWLLQNDWMARHKQAGWLNAAVALHCTIYTGLLTLGLWLGSATTATPPSYLTFSLSIFISHWLIDAGGLAERWSRLYRQTATASVRMMVDQTLHLLVIALLVQWL